MPLNTQVKPQQPRRPRALQRNVLRLCKLTDAPSQLQSQLPNPIQLSLLSAFHVPITLAAGKLIAAHHSYTAHISNSEAPAGSVDTLDLPDGQRDLHRRTRAVSRHTPNFNFSASVASDGGETRVTWKATSEKKPPATQARQALVPPWVRLRRFILRTPEKKKKKTDTKPARITLGATQYGESIASYRMEIAAKRYTASVERRSNSTVSLKTRGKLPHRDRNLNLRTSTLLDLRKGKCPLKIETSLKHKNSGRTLELKAGMDGNWRLAMAPDKNTTLTVDNDGDITLEARDCIAEWCRSDLSPSLRVPVRGFGVRVSKRGVRVDRWGAKGGFALKAAPDDIALDARCSVRSEGVLQRQLVFRAGLKQGIQVRYGRFY